MKVYDTGSFPAVRAGRPSGAGDSAERAVAGGAATRSGEVRVVLSGRVADVAHIRELALAAPDCRPEVVEAARQAMDAGTLSVDSAELAERMLADLGW